MQVFTELPPFGTTKNDTSVIFAILEGVRPEMPKEVEEISGLKELVQQCWSEDPKKRPSAAEVCEALARST